MANLTPHPPTPRCIISLAVPLVASEDPDHDASPQSSVGTHLKQVLN